MRFSFHGNIEIDTDARNEIETRKEPLKNPAMKRNLVDRKEPVMRKKTRWDNPKEEYNPNHVYFPHDHHDHDHV